MFIPLPPSLQAKFEQLDVGGRKRQAVFGRGASDALLQFGWNANVALHAYWKSHKSRCTTAAHSPNIGLDTLHLQPIAFGIQPG